MSYAQAFALLHTVAGKPTMRCIGPRSTWTVPPVGTELLELTMGGVVDSGNKSVRILAADRATVEAAEFILVDGLEYRVTESTPNVTGNPTGYTVRMVKR